MHSVPVKVECSMGFSPYRHWLHRVRPASSSRQQARSGWQMAPDLIQAVDQGGIALNPARINAIARRRGLEVSRHARVEDTIARIRQALERRPDGRE